MVKLSSRKEVHPFLRIIGAEDAKICFNFLIGLLNLSICLRMICVTEFVPLHNIPYIFLSPDSQPYLSIEEFLASPDRQRNLSTFNPTA